MFTVRHGKLVCTTTRDEAVKALHDLANMDSSTLYKGGQPWTPTHNSKSKTGLLTPTPGKLGLLEPKKTGRDFSNFFSWRDRARVDKPGHVNIHKLLERWRKNPESGRKAMQRVQKYAPNRRGEDLLFYAARMGSSFMSVNMFPPGVSKFFADALGSKRVLDFSAGWLDRLAGFLAAPSVQSITLIEPRPSAAKYAQEMVQIARKELKHAVQLKMHVTGAEKIMPKMTQKFDLIISSPPYFHLEQYDVDSKNAKLQVMATCSNNQEYLDKFLFPVVDAATKLLTHGGVLVINIDDNSHRKVDVCGPLVHHMQQKQGMSLVGTMGLRKNVLVNSMPNSVAGRRGEPVYIWCRGSDATARSVRAALTQGKTLPLATTQAA
jgi:hypothetical protein